MNTKNDISRLSASGLTRRDMLASGALTGGAILLGARAAAQQPPQAEHQHPGTDAHKPDQGPLPPGEPGREYTSVVVPNGWTLPYKVVDGVKVFHSL
ncbi:MAG: hypothetical protein SGJ11_03135 [Phycisphaerae bacterium]|nr:hypothetical protein [Phycisphaerae bacterium]